MVELLMFYKAVYALVWKYMKESKSKEKAAQH